jgi:hypothetical protein
MVDEKVVAYSRCLSGGTEDNYEFLSGYTVSRMGFESSVFWMQV